MTTLHISKQADFYRVNASNWLVQILGGLSMLEVKLIVIATPIQFIIE